ncbi:MAG: exo-alpha-sialidase [Thermoleophilaceae bacterium]|nr:exo-alpha-sialidase [Thermoleophilaceae bacterium]
MRSRRYAPPSRLRGGGARLAVLAGLVVACLLALGLLSTSSAELSSQPDVAVTPEDKDAFQQPNLAVDPTDPKRLTMAYQEGNRHEYCALARSEDGGRTWRSERVAGKGAKFALPPTFPQCYDPFVAYGPDGTLYYQYEPRPGTNPLGERQVIVTVAPPGGDFAQPREVDPIDIDHTDLWSDIAVDPSSGRLYVSFLRYCEPSVPTPEALAKCQPDPGQLVVATSGDKGRTFSATRVTPPTIPDPSRQSLAVDAVGTLYAVFTDGFFGSGPATLRVAVSRDEAKAFSEPATVATVGPCSGDLCYAPESSGRNFFHALGGKRGEVFIAYWDKQGDKNRIFFTASKDGGVSFSAPRVVGVPPGGESHEQHRPRLALTPQGKLYLAYYDFRPEGEGGFHDTYLIESSDRGQSFSAPRKITDVSSNARVGSTGRTSGRRLANFGQRLGLASTPEGAPLVAWTDSRRGTELSGKQDIFFEGAPAGPSAPGGGVGARGCLNFRAGVRAKRLGQAALGRTRKAHRRLFKGARLSVRAGMDRYCIAGGGSLRIGYPTARLNRTLGRAQRRRVRGRALLVLTSSRRYAIRRVRPGMRTAALRRRLRGERRVRVRVGVNVWYVLRGPKSTHVFKTRAGKVREIGLADKRLTKTPRATTQLLRAYEKAK